MPATAGKDEYRTLKVEQRWDAVLSNVEKYISGIFLGIATLLVVVAVILRFCFGYSSSIIEEAVRYLIIWSVFVGGSLALKNNVHITVDILTIRLPVRTRLVLQTFAYLAGIAYCILLAVKGMQLVHNSILIDERTTSAWRLPMFIPRLAVPVGAMLFIVRFAQKAMENINALRCGDWAGEEMEQR